MTRPDANRGDLVQAALLENETVLRLTLDAPPGNILDIAMVRRLAAALEAHRDRRGLRLVVLRGAGRHFSYGASVAEHRAADAPEMLGGFHRLVRQLLAFPVPTAALVDGQCLGGGFETVLACHFVFATPAARFACPEIRLGVFPPVLAVLGPERLGRPLAERLLLTGEAIDARQAAELGVATAVLAGDDPESELLAWYRERLAPSSAFALRQATEAVRRASGLLERVDRGLEAAERHYLESLLPSHDGNEGIEAFLAKRPPAWHEA